MTKLEAVNIILRSAGLAGVSSLDTGGNSNAAQAERVLDEVEQRVQTHGWHFNTRRDVTLSPDGSDNILLPTGVITIDTSGCDKGRDVTQVGGKLYDLDDNTDEFDGDLICTYIIRESFGCIPPPFQEWIANAAALAFNEEYHGLSGDPQRRGKLDIRATRAEAEAKRWDNRLADTNILDTWEADRVKGHRRRYW